LLPPLLTRFPEKGSLRTGHFPSLYEREKGKVERRLAAIAGTRRAPASVYAPMRYVLSSGGKRLRAMLLLLSAEAVGGHTSAALDAAAAIEILHNFTLVHDDVMDHAPLRRNRPTIHAQWDENVAILAGDELIAYAYRSLLKGLPPARATVVLGLFTDAFIEVCEGQGFDKEFELRRQVTLAEYRRMIVKKTARVIAAATQIGGIIGGGTARQITALRTFGEQLGLAFQIQDDLLDVDGDERVFGKRIGGDIVEGKKTFLLLTALARTRGADRALLVSLSPKNGRSRVAHVRAIYRRAGVLDAAREAIARHTRAAERALGRLPQNRGRAMLAWIAGELVERRS
jgi:geranylgeranyl diphosphate synthase type II